MNQSNELLVDEHGLKEISKSNDVTSENYSPNPKNSNREHSSVLSNIGSEFGIKSPSFVRKQRRPLTVDKDESAFPRHSSTLAAALSQHQNLPSSSDNRIPEVHFLGEISHAVGFSSLSDAAYAISCKWTIEWGKSWSFVAGEYSGQTQYSSGECDSVVWNHPIDIHFASVSVQGWPRIVLQVWELDRLGRTSLIGYGFSHLPCQPGFEEVTISCWRPCGTVSQEIQAFFLGANPQLTDDAITFGKAWDSRSRLVTVSSGEVHFKLSVIHRFFEEQLVDIKEDNI